MSIIYYVSRNKIIVLLRKEQKTIKSAVELHKNGGMGFQLLGNIGKTMGEIN